MSVERSFVGSGVGTVFTLKLFVCRVTVLDMGLKLRILPKPLTAHLTQVRPDPKVHLVDMFFQCHVGLKFEGTVWTFVIFVI